MPWKSVSDAWSLIAVHQSRDLKVYELTNPLTLADLFFLLNTVPLPVVSSQSLIYPRVDYFLLPESKSLIFGLWALGTKKVPPHWWRLRLLI